MHSSSQTKTAGGGDFRVKVLHERREFFGVFFSLLHVADGKVDSDEETEITVVGVL